MSNKISFSEPGVAKLSWKVFNGKEQINEELDAVRINMNGSIHEADTSKTYFETEISQTTQFSISVDYNGMTTSSSTLKAEYKEKPSIVLPGYYGSVVTGIEYADEYGDLLEWSNVKSQYDEFLTTLNDETISIMIDNSPIEGSIAHPNTLVSSSSITPNNHNYDFICRDGSVKKSHPIVIYPEYHGEVSAIKNALGTNAAINSNTMDGFYKTTITLHDETYIVYMQKQAASNTSKSQLQFIK